eukprot:CAMPEP_0197490800 /NCGR_PEP_ID=MMETSP1311-20131121/5243_1 /TAXON_ID=464262 /ORGANISM="Genus nov. species nov., Strain RCC856" /LENGTH=353 /DNA_ID=CAMNT_0043035371 /DNA_START=87 /DNA_END=1145 /DNA_ORIENTATION=+
MNEQEVAVQITQMVQFIRKEAEEKASEIRAAAQEEYTIQKQTMVEAEKAKIRKEYERKRSQIDTKKAIESSTQLNTARLKVLQAQQDAIDQAVENARSFLPQLAQNAGEYKQLMGALLLQAVKRFGPGSDLKVRCLQKDAAIVSEQINAAKQGYTAATKQQAPQVSVDAANPLTDAMGGGGGVDVGREDRVQQHPGREAGHRLEAGAPGAQAGPLRRGAKPHQGLKRQETRERERKTSQANLVHTLVENNGHNRKQSKWEFSLCVFYPFTPLSSFFINVPAASAAEADELGDEVGEEAGGADDEAEDDRVLGRDAQGQALAEHVPRRQKVQKGDLCPRQHHAGRVLKQPLQRG